MPAYGWERAPILRWVILLPFLLQSACIQYWLFGPAIRALVYFTSPPIERQNTFLLSIPPLTVSVCIAYVYIYSPQWGVGPIVSLLHTKAGLTEEKYSTEPKAKIYKLKRTKKGKKQLGWKRLRDNRPDPNNGKAVFKSLVVLPPPESPFGRYVTNPTTTSASRCHAGVVLLFALSLSLFLSSTATLLPPTIEFVSRLDDNSNRLLLFIYTHRSVIYAQLNPRWWFHSIKSLPLFGQTFWLNAQLFKRVSCL